MTHNKTICSVFHEIDHRLLGFLELASEKSFEVRRRLDQDVFLDLELMDFCWHFGGDCAIALDRLHLLVFDDLRYEQRSAYASSEQLS